MSDPRLVCQGAGLCLFCCFQPLCVVIQQSCFGLLFVFFCFITFLLTYHPPPQFVISTFTPIFSIKCLRLPPPSPTPRLFVLLFLTSYGFLLFHKYSIVHSATHTRSLTHSHIDSFPPGWVPGVPVRSRKGGGATPTGGAGNAQSGYGIDDKLEAVKFEVEKGG